MPQYPACCTVCGWTGDIVAPVRECGSLKCPSCNEPASQDYARKGVPAVGNRAFVGDRQISVTEGFHSGEVDEARKTYGADVGQCIQDDGTVRFPDRETQKRYMRRKAEVIKSQGRNPGEFGAKPRRPVEAP